MLPPELKVWSGLAHIKRRGRNEWSSACPRCGEFGHIPKSPGDTPDRFRMWGGPRARGWCRSCNYFEFAKEDVMTQLDPVEILEIEEHRRRQENQERLRVAALINKLQQEAYWRGYHDAMSDEHRKMWEAQGITPDLQDYFSLGYTEDKMYYYESELHHSPALTIPYFATGEEVVNVQYKLMKPVDGAGKYRFTKDLPAPFYLTEPDKPLSGDTCLLVEGAKKAIILYSWLGHKYSHVIGTPSKYMSDWMYTELKEFETVFLLFDPDSFTDNKDRDKSTVMRAASNMTNSRIVELPVKPDDFIVEYHQPAGNLHRIIQTARRPQ